MMGNDDIENAKAADLDYDELDIDSDEKICNKYKTFCHIVAALLISAAVVILTTFGILYFG